MDGRRTAVLAAGSAMTASPPCLSGALAAVLAGAAALVALAALAPPAAGFVGTEIETAYWGNATARAEVSGGDLGRTLTVVFRNVDTATMTGVEAEMTLPAGLTPTYAGAHRAELAGSLAPGATWHAGFKVDLAQGLAAGQQVNLTGLVRMNPDGGQARQLAFAASLAVTGRTNVSVVSAVEALSVHDRTLVPVALRNGGDARAAGLEVAVAPGTGSSLKVLDPVAAVRLGSLAAGGEAVVNVTVLTPSTPGLQTLAVRLAYVDGAGSDQVRTHELPFVVGDEPLGPVAVALRTERVTAGRDQVLVFAITNARGGPLRELSASLAFPASAGAPPAMFPRNASAAAELGQLAPNATALFTVPVFVAPGAAPSQALTLTLAWQDEGPLSHTRSYDLGVAVEGAMDLAFSATCAAFDAARRAVVAEGTVTNLGNTPAHNAEVRLVAAPGLGPARADELGELDPNDPVDFDLEGDLAPGVAVPGQVDVEARWNDDLGGTRAVTAPVPLRASCDGARPVGGERGTPAPAVALGLAGVAVAALLRARGPPRR